MLPNKTKVVAIRNVSYEVMRNFFWVLLAISSDAKIRFNVTDWYDKVEVMWNQGHHDKPSGILTSRAVYVDGGNDGKMQKSSNYVTMFGHSKLKREKLEK